MTILLSLLGACSEIYSFNESLKNYSSVQFDLPSSRAISNFWYWDLQGEGPNGQIISQRWGTEQSRISLKALEPGQWTFTLKGFVRIATGASEVLSGSVTIDLDVGNNVADIHLVLANNKEITSFSYYHNLFTYYGNIDHDAKTIVLPLPASFAPIINVSTITPNITFIGASITPTVGQSFGSSAIVPYTVSASDGTNVTYHARVEFEALSSNTQLQSLNLTDATLNVSFDPSTLTYSASTNSSGISFSAKPQHGFATMHYRINGATLMPLAITTPTNVATPTNTTIEIVVTAEDGSTTQTYTISVNKIPLPINISFDLNTGMGTNPLSVQVPIGSYFSLPNVAQIRGPIANGSFPAISQRFVAWNNQADGLGSLNYPIDRNSKFPLSNSIPVPPTDTTFYAIWTTGTDIMGKNGPGGGLVFYDKGTSSEGWQYLEVFAGPRLSSDAEAPKLAWSSPANLSVTTENIIGKGVFDSLKVVSQSGHISSAAQSALDFTRTVNGINYDDWFLPSRYEANEIYTKLATALVGDEAMWSSSQADTLNAYSPSRSIPNSTNSKSYLAKVYPIRAFDANDTLPRYRILYLVNGKPITGLPIVELNHYRSGDPITIQSGSTWMGTFAGWNTLASGLGADWTVGPNNMPSYDLILYAK